ncbi:MAG: winged helix-turn-helix transcriptional regulator [Thermoplasmatota archaeon]
MMRVLTPSLVPVMLSGLGLMLIAAAAAQMLPAQMRAGPEWLPAAMGHGWPLLFVPLYSRLKQEGLLNHMVRELIFGYVLTHPGANFSQIMRELNLKNGVLAYHLGTLERVRMIRSMREGAFRRYYPCSSGGTPVEMERVVLRKICELPGAPVGALIEELGLDRSALDRHILSLVRKGLVRVERRGKRSLLFATRVAS